MLQAAHRNRHNELLDSLSRYEANHGKLPGIVDGTWRDTLVAQMISSLRRIEYIRTLVGAQLVEERLDPTSDLFDPLRGSVLLSRKGQPDEAIWLAFVATHFGKHLVDGWKLSANVFGSFGSGPIWTAASYGAAPKDFANMLDTHQVSLSDPKQSGRFSNHRQYQSKKPSVIARVFQTFHEWQFEEGGFPAKMRRVHEEFGQEPTRGFDVLYRSMKSVYGFGRLGNFDFLTMIGKLDLAPITPGSAYLAGATGPLSGAKLLFHGARDFKAGGGALGQRVDALDEYLGVGKQVLEDSLCNWQKSPAKYEYFRG